MARRFITSLNWPNVGCGLLASAIVLGFGAFVVYAVSS